MGRELYGKRTRSGDKLMGRASSEGGLEGVENSQSDFLSIIQETTSISAGGGGREAGGGKGGCEGG